MQTKKRNKKPWLGREHFRKRRYQPVPGRSRLRRLPTPEELDAIPLVHVVEYQITDKETARLRARIYKRNKEGRGRTRTLREGSITLLWRIA